MRLAERHEVRVGRSTGVDGAGLENRSDLAQGGGVIPVDLAVDRRDALAGPVETEDQAHGGGLACAVRPQESGYDPWRHREREVVDGKPVAVLLGEIACLNHGDSFSSSLRQERLPPSLRGL
jgi:hypothetical protein